MGNCGYLVGGWTNPYYEKYWSTGKSSPNRLGVKTKYIWNHHLVQLVCQGQRIDESHLLRIILLATNSCHLQKTTPKSLKSNHPTSSQQKKHTKHQLAQLAQPKHNPGPTTGNPRFNRHRRQRLTDCRSMFCLWRIITFNPCLAIIRPRGPWMREGRLKPPVWLDRFGRVKCVPEVLRKILRSFQDSLTSGLFHLGKICTKKLPPPRMFPGSNIHIQPRIVNNPKSLNSWQKWLFTNSNFWIIGDPNMNAENINPNEAPCFEWSLGLVLGWLTGKNRGHWGSRYM